MECSDAPVMQFRDVISSLALAASAAAAAAAAAFDIAGYAFAACWRCRCGVLHPTGGNTTMQAAAFCIIRLQLAPADWCAGGIAGWISSSAAGTWDDEAIQVPACRSNRFPRIRRSYDLQGAVHGRLSQPPPPPPPPSPSSIIPRVDRFPGLIES